MSEKDTIVTWNEAAELFKANPSDLSNTRVAAEKFETLAFGSPQQGVSKLCYNAAILHKFLGNLPESMTFFNMCLDKDPHNAMAYFQRATVWYQLNRFAESAKDNQKCVNCMRQVTVIDYTQLGLRSKLYQVEAIFNEAACHLRLGNSKNCSEALAEVKSLMERDSSSAPKSLDINGVLQSLKNGANAIDIVQRGVDKLYTPPQVKLNNIAKKNYLGKAKVVSSLQSDDTFSGFVGPKLLAENHKKKAPPDRPDFPRSMTPIPKDEPRSDSRSNGGQANVLNEFKSLQLNRPESPTGPPPKLGSKPSPTPRTAVKNATASTPTQQSNGTASKPALAAKPTMCQFELISGPLSETMFLPVSTNYLKLMGSVQKTLGYPEGSFSLWYMNRLGTYTAVEDQEVVEHVWKWKVKDNRMTIYVFGV